MKRSLRTGGGGGGAQTFEGKAKALLGMCMRCRERGGEG